MCITHGKFNRINRAIYGPVYFFEQIYGYAKGMLDGWRVTRGYERPKRQQKPVSDHQERSCAASKRTIAATVGNGERCRV